jgi:hypothetical protein
MLIDCPTDINSPSITVQTVQSFDTRSALLRMTGSKSKPKALQ